MKKLHIIKIGGNCIDDRAQLEGFLKDFSALKEPKILIHGGGKLATQLADKLGFKQILLEGRRITDLETLNVTVMVYAGLINKRIVSKLQALQCNAIGLCGADGNLIRSKKREVVGIDFGYVGDVIAGGVNSRQLEQYLNRGEVPVISPISHDGDGNLLNTNADTMAMEIASALCVSFDVILTYCFEKKGVLLDVDKEESCLPSLNNASYLKLKSEGIISKGMIPKLDNAFSALERGVSEVSICHAKHISYITKQTQGTQVVL